MFNQPLKGYPRIKGRQKMVNSFLNIRRRSSTLGSRRKGWTSQIFHTHVSRNIYLCKEPLKGYPRIKKRQKIWPDNIIWLSEQKTKIKRRRWQKKRLDISQIVHTHLSLSPNLLAPNLPLGSRLPSFEMSTRFFGCRQHQVSNLQSSSKLPRRLGRH